MTIPTDIHHRRRIMYAALLQVLAGDIRAFVLFTIWDRHFRGQVTFTISPFVEMVAQQGLLTPEEQRNLKRAVFQKLSIPYEQLGPYPRGLVPPVIRPQGRFSATPLIR